MPRAPGCRWAKVRQAWCCPPWNCRSYKRAVPDEEAARPDRAVPSGYPRRRWQPGPRASASRGAPRMTPAGQDRRARGWAGPATGAARAGGHRAGHPGRPPDRSMRPRAVRSNAGAREGLGPPRRRCPATRGRLRARPRRPSSRRRRWQNPSPSSLPPCPVPGFLTKATSTAAQLSPDATTTTCP